MAKKSSGKASGGKSSGSVAVDLRRKSAELYAKARILDARADLKDAENPPKKPRYGSRGYPC